MPCREMKRSKAESRFRVHVRAFSYKKLTRINVSICRGGNQSCRASRGSAVNVRSFKEEKFDNVAISFPCRFMNGASFPIYFLCKLIYKYALVYIIPACVNNLRGFGTAVEFSRQYIYALVPHP